MASGDHSERKESNESAVDRMLETWCRVVADGDWATFQKRLDWDDLDVGTLRRVLGDFYHSDGLDLPPWTRTLTDAILEQVIPTTDLDRCLDANVPLPFENLFLSFVSLGRKQLRARTGRRYNNLTSPAHAELERSLLKRLVHISRLALELELSIYRAGKHSTFVMRLKNAPDTTYQGFVEALLTGGIVTFLREYSVLARLVATSVDSWVDATAELITRLTADRRAIRLTFQPSKRLGKVVSVHGGLSDRHESGRSVLLIRFSSGLRLVYKPKDIGIEHGYAALLSWLNSRGLWPSLKGLKVLPRTTYGWTEFVETSSCGSEQEVSRYYRRCGMLVCLAYVLQSTDLHHENLIASGEYPILVDLETLMHPWARDAEEPERTSDAEVLAHQQLWHSVVRTALLPQWRMGSNGHVYDSSGLGSTLREDRHPRQLRWFDVNSGGMPFGDEVALSHVVANAPLLANAPVPLDDYHAAIVDGFTYMYRFLLTHRDSLLFPGAPLDACSGQVVRFIFRHTQAYNLLLRHTLNPKYLRDGGERSIQFDVLSRPMLASSSRPISWSLLRLEQDSLERMDVPHFTVRSDSSALVVGGETIENYFTAAGYDLLVSRVKMLDEEDLERQTSLMRSSLHARVHYRSLHTSGAVSPRHLSASRELLSADALLQVATRLAEMIETQSIVGRDGSATWLAPQYIASHKGYPIHRLQLQPMGYSLFDGAAGVSLFLSAIHRFRPKARYRELALAALQPLCEQVSTTSRSQALDRISIGGGLGSGSIVYALVRISQFLGEPALLDVARRVASSVTQERISADTDHDLMSGAAGAILGLLALWRESADSDVLQCALHCGTHLVEHRVTSASGYRTWATVNNRLLTGLSHGAAGIAYALLRLFEVTGANTFKLAAREAILYERSVFVPGADNWPDFRSAGVQPDLDQCNWAHGATGIGLARCAGFHVCGGDDVRDDIRAAVRATLRHSVGDVDHVCNGNLGRIGFLFTAGRLLSEPDLIQTALLRTTDLVAAAEQRGHFDYGLSLTFHPGFFPGASGIGYELLRIAQPELVPSAAVWE